MAYLYEHFRFDKGEEPVCFYVGIGSDEEGKFSRAFTSKSRNEYWYNITNLTDYSASIKIDNISWEEACTKEIELIKHYGRSDLGSGSLCNLTDGGDGILNVSDEVKQKISLANSGRRHSEIAKDKMREYRKGIKLSDEHRTNISNSLLGKKCSDETKAKISKVKKGKSFGGNKKQVIDSDSGIVYTNAKAAAIKLNINYKTLNQWLNNKRPNKSSLKYV